MGNAIAKRLLWSSARLEIISLWNDRRGNYFEYTNHLSRPIGWKIRDHARSHSLTIIDSCRWERTTDGRPYNVAFGATDERIRYQTDRYTYLAETVLWSRDPKSTRLWRTPKIHLRKPYAMVSQAFDHKWISIPLSPDGLPSVGEYLFRTEIFLHIADLSKLFLQILHFSENIFNYFSKTPLQTAFFLV